MANSDNPRGAWPLRHVAGGIVRANEYPIETTYGSNIFTGDFVALSASGGVNLAAAGNRLLGVFGGVNWTASDGEKKFSRYWPASTVATDAKALVYDDPFIEFGIQAASSILAVDVGQLANHLASTGDASTGQSSHELDGTTTTATAGLRILGKIDAPDNAYGANVNLRVQVHEHELAYHGQTNPGV